MQIDQRENLISPIRRIVQLLVTKEYDEIERITGGRRLSSSELQEAVLEYGKPLTMPPDSAWDELDIILVRNRSEPTFSIRFDLWCGGKRSDLSLEVTLVEIGGGDNFQVEVDDLHVL